jgi:hypothetical protein
MNKVIEKKVIANWENDKGLFDNLKVGNLISKERIICYKNEEENLITVCWRTTFSIIDSISTVDYKWNGQNAELNEFSRNRCNENHLGTKREKYGKLHNFLMEARL